MSLLDTILEAPGYGWEREGKLVVPTHRQILREFFHRLNIFRTRKNWLPVFSWMTTLVFAVPLWLFLTHYFTWPRFVIGFVYSMVVLGTHGTIYYHRYGTHRTYLFANKFWLYLTQNLVVKIVPEEQYIISHHVHHAKSEKPGDPYNVHGGWLYCFLADVNHQLLRRDLTPAEYRRVVVMLEHTGIALNDYPGYLRWGSAMKPWAAVAHVVVNWAFWYGVFYWMGGHALACTIFGSCGVWGIGIRTFNYAGHGGGKDKRREGIDFNRADLSINQLWPGLITGEWHNNHHLYPAGARNGFQPYQLDYAWWYIKLLYKIGGIRSYRDFTADFYRDHYEPYLRRKRERAAARVKPAAITPA